VLALDVGRLFALVAVEVAETTAPLLDDLDTERAVVLDVPAKHVAVVDVEFPADTAGTFA
jgi:hypothetical protein